MPCFKKIRLLVAVLLVPALAACAQVTRSDYAPVVAIPADGVPAPIMFSRYRLDLALGETIGTVTSGERLCGWPHRPVSRTYLRRQFDIKSFDEGFEIALEGQGYDVVGDRAIMFDEDEEYLRTEYKVSARITAVELNACEQAPGMLYWLFRSHEGTTGEIHFTVDWSVYDTLARKVVYRTTTTGYAKRDIPNEEGLALLAADAFEMAAHNLGADESFRDLIFYGVQPAKPVGDQLRERVRLFDPREKLTLPALPLSRQDFTSVVDDVRAMTVMVQAGAGHGSGFFISRDGHILTNQHVVGAAQRVRIVLPEYHEALVAEVLRRDDRRDVALLKLEDLPGDLAIAVRPVRLALPAVSEDVYAVGAPLNKRLQDTVSKGIVSAYREEFKLAHRQNYIQADVDIHGGNSGGPLLDARGNIIGLSVAGYGDNGSSIGLNFFIPIAEGLAALDITVAGERAPGAPTVLAP